MKRSYLLLSRFLLIIFILLVSFSLSSAFSIATLYSENYPLRMKQGEVKETFFLLRNVVDGDSDTTIRTELISGKEIANLIEGKDYDVPFGSEIEVPVRIEI